MPQEALKKAVSDYIAQNNTCALATGIGDYVRCTPIEYSFHDGKFWMFSEGGKKFVGLEKLESPMNLICVTPTEIQALFSDFKAVPPLYTAVGGRASRPVYFSGP